jgi:NAD(P)-dependent dehydrogenase (short-subunit alcohol dehydrogenase family)/acyl carrier protein
VVIISGDDVTQENSLGWIGSGLFASGAATTEGNLRLAAVPFDKRRNGMIIGMGAAALVVESEDAARERGVRGIGEILATVTANSAFHGTRLDQSHVSEVMERLLRVAEMRFGIDRHQIAPETVFMSHETYTPARGGSASAEIRALRQSFGEAANQVIIANTKGYTGHSMGVGIEDVVVTKALETGIVPPIAHILDGFEPDPELGDLNLSRGGKYNPQYALRLGAGFGSQIAMTLVRRIPGAGERINREIYRQWLASMSGYEAAETETVKRTLRIKDLGVPAHEPQTATWEYGQIPSCWVMSGPAAEIARLDRQSHTPGEESHAVEVQQVTVPAAPEVIIVSNPEKDAIQQHVLAEVSQHTGYPVEMLDLDLDLEADLGIDTVKQAELFAAIRSYYGIPRKEDLILADYNTLTKVIGFVEENLNPGSQAVPQEPQTEVGNVSASEPSVEPMPAILPANGDKPITDETNGRGEIKQYVLSEVSDKTGYPVEMLDLDLDLEADLGIDTVKQAELFAAIRTHYGIPRKEDLVLTDYNTLAKVIQFVLDELPVVSQAKSTNFHTPSEGEDQRMESPLKSEDQGDSKLGFRVPSLVLIPKIELCQSTQVDLAKRNIVIVADSTRVSTPLLRKLKECDAIPVVVGSRLAAEKVDELAKAGRLGGVYYLAALDEKTEQGSPSADTWQKQRSILLNPLFKLARVLPESAFLMCATAMGGLLGFINSENPQHGLISGFAKALHRERPNQLIKLVDFSAKTRGSQAATVLLEESLHDPVTTEIGYEGDSRYSVALRDLAMENLQRSPLRQSSVFLVSGASGGITAPILLDLARATHGSFFLLGRTPLPSRNDPDLLAMRADRKAFRNELQKRLIGTGEKPTPVQLDNRMLVLERAASMADTLDAIQSAGGSATYIVCDVTHPQSVKEAVDKLRKETDHVDYFLHAAGIEKSRKIESKSEEEFDQIVAVKTDSFIFLLNAMQTAHLVPASMVLFSSLAGRFGNAGQTDYSAANDTLSKFAVHLPEVHPGMKAISIDWGAWDEVGMASRGNIPTLMKRAGIEMLSPVNAAPMVRKALEYGLSGEYVVAGALGGLSSTCKDNCGVDIDAANQALRAGTPIHEMFSRVTSFTVEQGVRLEAEMDPSQESFLEDHKINGIPVLPGVVGIEGFLVAAKHIASVLGSSNGAFEVDHLENVQFMAPFKFYGNKPRTIQWTANAFRTPMGVRVEASLESDIARRNRDVQHLIHFTACIYLTPGTHETREVAKPPKWSDKNLVTRDDIYRLYFHGPSFQVLESAKINNGVIWGKFNKSLLQSHEEDPSLYTTPLLIEMCFQTAGLYEAGSTGILALPRSIGTLKLFKQSMNGAAIYAEVRPSKKDNEYSFDARVVDEKGNVFLELSDYRTAALPYSAEAHLVEPLKKLTGIAE